MNQANTSGLLPKGRAVLVRPYKAKETIGNTRFVLPASVQKTEQMAEQRAVVVEIGPNAWVGEPVPRAAVGDHILFSKWAGYAAVGVADGNEYRVVNDSDIFLQIVVEGEGA